MVNTREEHRCVRHHNKLLPGSILTTNVTVILQGASRLQSGCNPATHCCGAFMNWVWLRTTCWPGGNRNIRWTSDERPCNGYTAPVRSASTLKLRQAPEQSRKLTATAQAIPRPDPAVRRTGALDLVALPVQHRAYRMCDSPSYTQTSGATMETTGMRLLPLPCRANPSGQAWTVRAVSVYWPVRLFTTRHEAA